MTEIQKLKQMARDLYETDGGEMLECFSDTDYAQLIEQKGTAEKAWAFHLRILEAQREAGGFYESF
jgi:hypothetical protein